MRHSFSRFGSLYFLRSSLDYCKCRLFLEDEVCGGTDLILSLLVSLTTRRRCACCCSFYWLRSLILSMVASFVIVILFTGVFGMCLMETSYWTKPLMFLTRLLRCWLYGLWFWFLETSWGTTFVNCFSTLWDAAELFCDEIRGNIFSVCTCFSLAGKTIGCRDS